MSLLISVVTPSFNQGRFLEQTIRSVLEQDHPRVEYVLIDGGSADGSVEIIRKYADRLAYWRSEKDGGQSDALAAGFARSTGDVLCWLNSDDVFLPGALSAVARYFESHPEVEAVSGGGYYMDARGRPHRLGFGYYTLGVAATYDRFRFYEQDGVFQPAAFWRRSAYKAVGGVDRDLKFIMDRDLFTRLARRRRFGRLARLLAGFRLHETSKTAKHQEIRRRESALFRERYGVSRYPWVTQRALYWRYRLPSLLHKGCLVLRQALDRVKLPPANA